MHTFIIVPTKVYIRVYLTVYIYMSEIISGILVQPISRTKEYKWGAKWNMRNAFYRSHSTQNLTERSKPR